ncbi:MAG TPA: DNA-binding domain-containing protein [Rhodanobacteraceae bacterium]|nr:DNA-binding domain-containing protein [Rhodanobacteraceae bacterium]
MATPTALRAWQQGIARAIVNGDATARLPIHADSHADAPTRLGVYVDAYRLRLLDVLRQDFAQLAAAIGPPRFDALAHAYIACHPSDTPSIRWFGRHFASWLRARHTRPAWYAELAAFEWALGEVFDAADAESATLAQLSEQAPEAWPLLRPRLHSAQRLLRGHWNVDALYTAIRAGTPPSPARSNLGYWLLWRQDGTAHWRRLDRDEAAAWSAAAAQRPLSALGTALLRAGLTPEQAPERLAGLLQRWISDGLLTEFTHPA